MAKSQTWRKQSGNMVHRRAHRSGTGQYLYSKQKQKLVSPFAMLGKTGSFPTEYIIKVKLTARGQEVVDGIYVFRPKKGIGFPIGHVQGVSNTNIITQLKKQVYKPLVNYITNYINIDVPSDTNTLRETMINSMGARWGASRTTDIGSIYKFKIGINTGDLQYAMPVNNMPTLMVVGKDKYMGLQHPPNRFPGDTRNDPRARHLWWEHVTRIGRNYANILFRKFGKSFFRRYLQKYKKQKLIPKSWNETHIFKAIYR